MTVAKHPLNPEAKIILIEVILIGAKNRIPLKMVLDTGASITTIPTEAAIAIGCNPINPKKRIEMITASGNEYAPIVTIPKLELLGLNLPNIDVICHNLPSQSIASGLLGLRPQFGLG